MCIIKSFIVDDEPDSVQLLTNLLKGFKDICIEKVFTDANIAMQEILIEKPFVVFADIEMPNLNGIELLQFVNEYSPSTKVVFVTAYEHYALKALQEDAFDFLCKPLLTKDLNRVVYKLLAEYEKNKSKEGDNRIFLKTQEGYNYLLLKDISYLEADGNYTKIHLIDGKSFVASINIGKLMNKFPDKDFIRVSRKHVINKVYLSFVNFNKNYCILRIKNHDIQLSVSEKLKNLREILTS